MLILGHRGARGHAPENTMASFQAALDMGADGIELDVQMTKDGKIVVCHDHSLERTSNGTGWLVEHTREELRALDFGSWLVLSRVLSPLLLSLPLLLLFLLLLV